MPANPKRTGWVFTDSSVEASGGSRPNGQSNPTDLDYLLTSTRTGQRLDLSPEDVDALEALGYSEEKGDANPE